MTTTTLTSKGQLTLPQPLRAKHHLEAGTRFRVTDRPDGSIQLIPMNRRAEDVAGILHRPGADALSTAEVKRRKTDALKRKWLPA